MCQTCNHQEQLGRIEELLESGLYGHKESILTDVYATIEYNGHCTLGQVELIDEIEEEG